MTAQDKPTLKTYFRRGLRPTQSNYEDLIDSLQLVSDSVTTAQAVLRTGSTMTGLLILSGNPTASAGAATKEYADTKMAKSSYDAANITEQVIGVSAAQTLYNKTLSNPQFNTPYFANLNGFRLSLTSGVPVTTSDVTGATSIYLTPYKSGGIALYSGSQWVLYSSNEVSLALGTITSSKPYDVFAYNNSGVVTLEMLAWTNDTTRATSLSYQDGVLVKSGDATRRYLGSFYTTSTTTTEDSKANRFLWNYYNRVRKDMYREETTASWNYTTATIRAANGSVSNRLNFLVGVSEDTINADLTAKAGNTNANVRVASGIALDSTSNLTFGWSEGTTTGVGLVLTGSSRYVGIVGIGKHYLSWNEFSEATGTTTWYGGSTSGVCLMGSILC